MYRAKDAGKNCFQVFSPSQRARVVANHVLEVELREALEAAQLFLLYQPLFSIEDRSLCGVEALVRWNHPARGVIPPVEFLPLAEERGLITRIDSFVLDEACRQLAAWLAEGGWRDGFTMAVNISGRQLVDPSFASSRRQGPRLPRPPPGRLCLEITETTLNGEAGDVEATLAALSDQGVRLAIDDYGTGYSTLAHLHRLKVDISEDRPQLHRADRPHRPGHGDHRRHHGDVPRPRDDGRRRGDRDERAARRAHLARVRHRPGLPLRPPAPGRRDRRVPARRDTAPRVGSALAGHVRRGAAVLAPRCTLWRVVGPQICGVRWSSRTLSPGDVVCHSHDFPPVRSAVPATDCAGAKRRER